MVNILLVSHSFKLAQGTAELVRQMAPSPELSIKVAAGIGDDHEEIGTDAVEIMEALNELAEDKDVLVLMDLGSAVLSTEMALQMLDEEIASRVRMCPAPFVEGAIAAGVQANLGSPIQEVYEEAMNALAAKKQQIVSEDETLEPHIAPEMAVLEPEVNNGDKAAELQITVTNPSGLHARPAALFIQTVKKYDAKLTVTNRTESPEPVLIKGMISVMLLGAKQGDELFLQATGPEKDAVLAELKELFLDNFGE
ncbi:MAG: dihydroxyacetone kinase phosphoryl donor subunit DhaM [Anaerolineaceae bacterium]|jgi:phosphocarrier protein FPr|nr:dihydroxyacetone kinase phosphoryl donor subunit DhaM [Anaerolineaceae bacterium]